MAVDAPPIANAQLQSSARLRRGPDEVRGNIVAPMEVSSASLASISRKSGSKQMRMYSAAGEVKHGVERMRATWDGSMDEINGMIKGIADHDSASQDTCSTQLIEYRKKLTKIHESTISISIAVNSTSSEVSIFDKECHEKDEELKEIDLVHSKRVTKCTIERRVERKTLETLRYDMKSMKKVARAHIHLKSSGKKALLQQESDSHPRRSLADVRGMVKKTKETASKLQTCLAKAHLDKKKNEVALSEEQSEVDGTPRWRCDGIKPKCFPVTCTGSGWTCGEANQCPLAQPRCHPISCVGGHWQCGAVSDPAFEACKGKSSGETCKYALPNIAGSKVGKCLMQAVATGQKPEKPEIQPPLHSLLSEDAEASEETEADSKSEEDDHTDDDDDDNDDDDQDEEDIENDDEDSEDQVEVFLQEDSETSPLVSDLKCMPAGAPTECQEVVIELEHQFTESYVSLTRMIEEYE